MSDLTFIQRYRAGYATYKHYHKAGASRWSSIRAGLYYARNIEWLRWWWVAKYEQPNAKLPRKPGETPRQYWDRLVETAAEIKAIRDSYDQN